MNPEGNEGVGDLGDVRQEPYIISSRPRGALALLGAWADVGERDVDEWIDEIYAVRKLDTGRMMSDFGGR